jgi:hypothetical protein
LLDVALEKLEAPLSGLEVKLELATKDSLDLHL